MIQYLLTLTLVFFVIGSCGDNVENPALGPEQANEQTPNANDLQLHEKAEFFDSNWPSNAWDLLVEQESDFQQYDPSEPADPKFLESLPMSMASIGDSISRGALASYKRKDFTDLLMWVRLLIGAGVELIWDTKALFEDSGLSWTTGMGATVYRTVGSKGQTVKEIRRPVLSHALRLQMLRKDNKLNIYSGAVSGASSPDIREQLDKVLKHSRKNLKQETPDYVTILIGPNDICADSVQKMTSTNQFHDHVEYVVDQLLRKNSKSRVLISSIPNIPTLYDVGKEAPVGIAGNMTCTDSWDHTPFGSMCPLLMQYQNPSDHRTIVQRVKEYNESLQEISQQFSSAFGARVKYADTYGMVFKADHLSADCFHPNVLGQNDISQLTWEQSFWSK